MIRSFLTFTLRILWRNKVTSFVNIFSLSIGITSFIFIMLYVHHETTFDKFHENYHRIYRLEGDEFARLPPVIGDYVKDRIPEIINIAHLATNAPQDISYKPENNSEKIKFAKTNVVWADSTTFRVLTFPLVRGNAVTALRGPFKAVLTETTAKILFGETDPMGKTVEFTHHPFEITGIIRDPEKSHVEVGALVSMESIPQIFPDRNLNNTGPNSWLWSATYLLMENDIDEKKVEKKINEVLSEINDGNLINTIFKHFYIRPLKDIYFYGTLKNLDYAVHGNFSFISILFIIGIFMLVLAGINYVNLTTARSIIRTKEVAVKRVVGSSVVLIRFQLLLESVIVSVVSLIVALTQTQIFISTFNNVALTRIDLAKWNRAEVWYYIVGGTVALGIVAGIYPALYLTAVKPVRLMKGALIENTTGVSPRSVLMTFQFTLSIVLMICALASIRQLNYLRNANLGFGKEHLIQIETPASFEQEFELRHTFKGELLQLPGIKGVCFSPGTPGGRIGVVPIDIAGERRPIDVLSVDYDYLDVMDIKLVAGHSFPKKMLRSMDDVPKDKMEVIVNETFIREFDITSPIGATFRRDDPLMKRNFEIIGVVKDFHLRSLHVEIGPFMLFNMPPMYLASVKVEPNDLARSIEAIEKVWRKVYPGHHFTFSFLDETFDRQYKTDQQLATIIVWFTGLTLMIACLGLFALSSFMISRRTKEIGIRKCLGASTNAIYTMLSWNFVKWVFLAVMLGCPIAWYLTQLWLSKFAYHMELGFDIFIIAPVLAFIVALITITWQSLKAANANPIKALRYE